MWDHSFSRRSAILTPLILLRQTDAEEAERRLPERTSKLKTFEDLTAVLKHRFVDSLDALPSGVTLVVPPWGGT